MNNACSFLDFEGRWVVVTGASSGLGRAVAVELARHGAHVALIGRDRGRLDETAAQLGDAQHRVLPLDLQQTAGITPAILALRDEVGPLYGLCHAAGIVQTRPLAATSPEVVRSQLEINVVAGLEIARAVARRDVTTPEGGSLLFIASVYGHVGMAGQSGYSATKGAVTAAVRSLAVELARRKVRVNSISPGLVHTAMTQQSLGALAAEHTQKLEALHPLGPGQPSDVGRAAVFLLAPGSGWITGADLAVDGGYTAQ